HEQPELLGRHAQHPAGPGHSGAEVWALARYQVQLPDESTGTMRRDHDLVVALPDDLHLTLYDHEEVRRLIAGPVQHLTGLHRDLRTEGRDFAYGRRVQQRPRHIGLRGYPPV